MHHRNSSWAKAVPSYKQTSLGNPLTCNTVTPPAVQRRCSGGVDKEKSPCTMLLQQTKCHLVIMNHTIDHFVWR